MATTSFSESFKYGSRLFGFFLSILAVGGGLFGAGAYLAVPEIQGWLDTGSAETSLVAGGVVAGVVGVAVLSIGQFAVLYKLIADGVARGNADPAVDVAATPAAEETTDADEEAADESPVEQEAAVTGSPEQPPEPEQPREPAVDSGPQPEPDPPREPAQATPPEQPQEAEAKVEAETGREQTAEEIVFGSSDDSTAAESQEDASEFEDESESREGVGTAGNPSSDPLADNFDDE